MRIVLLQSALVALTACGGVSVGGTVTDVTGAPIEGAKVTLHAPGSMCQGTSGSDGAFSVGCSDGDYEAAISHAGYVTKKVDIKGSEQSSFELGPQALTKIPEKEGLFLLEEGVYREPDRGLLARNTEGPKGASTNMDYCLDRENSKVNGFAAGEISMYAREHTEWRVWKLGEEGCAYKKVRLDVRWEQTFGDQIKPDRNELEPGHELITLKLEPDTDYFLSDWKGGFFTAQKGEYADDRQRYGGWFFTTKK